MSELFGGDVGLLKKKKLEAWGKKSQLPFYIIIMAEISFHNYKCNRRKKNF